jgi:methyl-accepting chemotaxis protein
MDAWKVIARDLRRAQIFPTVVCFALAIVSLLMTGDLNQHLAVIVLFAAVMLPPMFWLHQHYCLWLLRPVHTLLLEVDGVDQPSSRAIEEANAALSSFRRKESLFSVVLWGVGLVLAWILLAYFMGITHWQLLELVVAIGSAAAASVLLGAYVEIRGLARARQELESIGSGLSYGGPGSRSMARSFFSATVVIVVIAVGLASLVWFSRLRVHAAGKLMADRQAEFKLVTPKIAVAIAGKENAILGEVLREADPTGKIRSNLVVLDGQGRVLFIPPTLRIDRTWFRRIVKDDRESWLEARAPFLYFTRRMSKDRILAWVAPLSLAADQVGELGWNGWFGAGMLVLACILLAWVAGRGSLAYLPELVARYKRLAAGELQAVSGRPLGGELDELNAAVAAFAQSFREMLTTSIDQTDSLEKKQRDLSQRMTEMRSAFDRRVEVADQTATSVIEMRSAIKSISEQMNSLRDTSSDCSSSMFEIDQSVREVAQSAENLQTMVEDTTSAMTEIAVSMNEVVDNVDVLAKTAAETVSSIAVIDGSIRQVEESTTQTHKVSEEVSELATRGAMSVSQTIEGINEIQEITDEAQEVINRLGNRMEAVGKILTVIGDVAEQTNLLALNAAIIAAAAGEHGKGFAVVADEIKDLADRTSTSTKEIAGLIRSVQAESRMAIDAIQRGSGSVRRGVELANNAGEALQQILKMVKLVSQMSNDIATTTTKHSNITRTITNSMSDISNMVREIKRAVAEQSEGGKRIQRASEQMRDDARFVYRSANEQVQAAAGVSGNMEKISEMVSFIGRAMNEQSNGVNHVAMVAENARDVIELERAQIGDCEETVDRMAKNLSELSSQLLSHVSQEDPKQSGEKTDERR